MEIIENNFLKVSVNLKGGNLTSIFFKEENEELLYQIEEGSWPFQDVVIFPLIGAGEFKYNEHDYKLEMRHGFLRSSDLTVLEKTDNKLVLNLKANKHTLLQYPFYFNFTLTYELIDNVLKVETKVKNEGENDLYFSYGSHTGLRAYPENGVINFDKDYKLLPLICGLIDQSNKDNMLFNCVNLKKESFKKLDTLVFEGNKEELKLYTGVKNICITYKFDAPYFAIWSNPNKGNFVCIEPWRGISNYKDESSDLSKRISINTLKKNEETSFSYTLTFENKD